MKLQNLYKLFLVKRGCPLKTFESSDTDKLSKLHCIKFLIVSWLLGVFGTGNHNWLLRAYPVLYDQLSNAESSLLVLFQKHLKIHDHSG